MKLYKLDIWIAIKDREGLAKALSIPPAFTAQELSEKIHLAYDPIYGDRNDMMHFFHGNAEPQVTDVVDYDDRPLRTIVPFLKSGGMSVYPFTGRDFYAQYLFRDGQIKEIPASIIWHIPDSNYFKTGDPAFPSLSVENQIEAVLKRQKKLFPKPRETQNKSPGKQKTL